MKSVVHPAMRDVRLENVLYALSDSVRLSIVQQLDKSLQMTCGEFSACGEKGKSTMTHHFKVLRDAGIIHTEIDGREHLTTLRKQELEIRFPGLLGSVLQAAAAQKKTASAAQRRVAVGAQKKAAASVNR